MPYTPKHRREFLPLFGRLEAPKDWGDELVELREKLTGVTHKLGRHRRENVSTQDVLDELDERTDGW